MKTIIIAILALSLTNFANTNYQVKKETKDDSETRVESTSNIAF